MSGADVGQQHSTWLRLVEIAGPFLTLPVLNRRLPQGLDPVLKPDMGRLRAAWLDWDSEQQAATSKSGDQERAHTAWVRHVVTDLLNWQDDADFAPELGIWEHTEPDTGVLIAASFLLRHPDQDKPFALGFTLGPNDSLTSRGGDGWPATAIDRVAVTLRQHDVPLGLVTNGRWWGVVWAPRGGVTAHCLWDAVLWIEDRVTLEAFTTLLNRYRQLSAGPANTLLAMLTESLDSQEEVTEQLGTQVRAAVEALVDALGRADERARENDDAATGRYLQEVDDDEVYQAAVTVLMRLVFMLAAEERQLLPSDDPVYAAAYSVAGLGSLLDQQAADDGEDALEHSTAGWHRLLAAFRVVHDGADHHDFRLPGYGGGLFDPDRHPWLEGRLRDGTVLPPISVDDRTVRQVVRALMWLQFRTKSGHESRRVTYRALDVEQIGYVYEGLLDHDAARATDWTLGFAGPNEPEIDLGILAQQTSQGGGGLVKWLAKQTGKTPAWVTGKLGEPPADDPVREALLAAVDGDTHAADRAMPFARLLRLDGSGLPVVIPPGRLHVTSSSTRGDTGTHYTPRTLAESVVAGALSALVHQPGPLETLDEDQWRTRTAADILALRVADIAMGSGAFLVAACRYLADKLIKAVSRSSRDSHDDPELRLLWDLLHDPAVGQVSGDELADEALVHARRLITERCLYGADINPLAVEMAKLSLWLVTSSRHRPFSFLDHRLVAGDSLLGLTQVEQLEDLHVVPRRGRELHSTLQQETAGVRRRLAEAAGVHTEISARPSIDLRAVGFKEERLAEAERLLGDIRVLADGVAAAALAGAERGPGSMDANTVKLALFVPKLLRALPGTDEHKHALALVSELSSPWLSVGLPTSSARRSPVQWVTRFPEVFLNGTDPGFDAIVGNPPFLGAKKQRSSIGTDYREYLVRVVADNKRGNADFVSYFFLRAGALCRSGGVVGLIATDSVRQTDTREVGLDQLVQRGFHIFGATYSSTWPSRSASLKFSVVQAVRAPAPEQALLDGEAVPSINSGLTAGTASAVLPLPENKDGCFQGSNINGVGFTMIPEEARQMVEADLRNRDVLKPYLGGDDLLSRADVKASRYIVDFGQMSEDQAASYRLPFEHVLARVKPGRDALPDYKRRVRERWWQYEAHAKKLYAAVKGLPRVIALPATTKYVLPTWQPTDQVFAHTVFVVVTDGDSDFAALSSNLHSAWAALHGSSFDGRPRYNPDDTFLTFPLPVADANLREAGRQWQDVRSTVQTELGVGLTKLYNELHNPDNTSLALQRLRQAQENVDRACFRAYGFLEGEPSLVFRETPVGLRYTLSRDLERDVLHQLHEMNSKRATTSARPALSRQLPVLSVAGDTHMASLFDDLVEDPA